MKHIIEKDTQVNKFLLFEGTECYMDSAYQFHREDGPAIIYPQGWEFWFFHGLRDRKDGPAVIIDNDHYYYDRNRLKKIRRYSGTNYIEELYSYCGAKSKTYELFELKTNNLEFFISEICSNTLCYSVPTVPAYHTYVMKDYVNYLYIKDGFHSEGSGFVGKPFQVTDMQIRFDKIEYLPLAKDDFYIKCLRYLPVKDLCCFKVGKKFQERILKMNYSNYKHLREIEVDKDLELRLVRHYPISIKRIVNPSIEVQEEVIKTRPDLINEIPNLDHELKEKYSYELELSVIDI